MKSPFFKIPGFVELLRGNFFNKLKHDLWTKDEIIKIFNEAILDSHMRQLEEYETSVSDD